MSQQPISASQITPDIPVIQSIYKTTTETISSDTDFTNDNAMVGYVLEPNGIYSFVGVIVVSFANVLMGTKLRFNASSGGIAASGIHLSGLLWEDTSTAVEGATSTSESVGMSFVGVNNTNSVMNLSGSIKADTEGAIVDMQWAQKVSNGSNLQYRAGSWLTFTRIG